jgi:four helix bundle protein
MFGLTSQLRRSAVSVASNIAEGQGRLSRGEFRQFLGQARGSLIEMETQLVIAENLGFLSSKTVAGLIGRSGEVSRLLHGLMKSLQPAEATPRTRNRKLGLRKPETAPNAKLWHQYG